MPERVPASRIPHEALVSLRHRLATLPARHPDRKHLVANAAALYGPSRSTLYRGLRQQPRPKPPHRADRGRPKVAAAAELERWCETIAAMKLRTLNGKGRHLSTAGAIRILEEHGVETPDGQVRLPPGLLSKPTANRYLRQWGYDHDRMTRAPAAARFQAEHSNALWHFDLSPSDLKHVEEVPAWVELLWWGLFDRDLYVEHGDARFGPYRPVGGPVPLHHYRRHKKGKREERADRVAALAGALQVPRAVLEGHPALAPAAGSAGAAAAVPRKAFADPDPYREFAYTNRVTAKLAIAAALGMPLARLTEEERASIDSVLAETLERRVVLNRVMSRLRPGKEARC